MSSFPFLAALSDKAVNVQYSSTNVFRVGQKGMTEDGSLYRLSKAGAAITNTLAGKINYWRYLTGLTGDIAEAAVAVNIAAGDMSFTITDATNSRAADYYKDGYAFIPNSGTYDTMKRVWKSDAEISDTYKIHVTAPFVYAYAAGGTIAVYPNPYSNVRNAGAYLANYEHFVAFANLPITSGNYFWGLVRGPHWCWITGTWPGAAASDRQCCFHQNGTVVPVDEKYNAATSEQIAGHLMYSGNYGDALLMVTLE